MSPAPRNSNPYAQAAGAYGDHSQKHTPDQRELEARVLQKAAHMLSDLKSGWESRNTEVLEETLKYNRQIWMLFYDTALENPEGERPDDLRSNILNLANFVFKHSIDIQAKPAPEKLDILIDINRNIAAGLMEGAKQDAAARRKAGDSQEKGDNARQADKAASDDSARQGDSENGSKSGSSASVTA